VECTFRRRVAAAICLLAGSAGPTAAQPLTCFGNEPSWSVAFSPPDRARVAIPETPPSDYGGKETRIEPLGEWVWRGRSAAGGDLVVFLRETACSDGMSDDMHPITARVSMPDFRFLAGCCRSPALQAGSTAVEGTSWRLASLPGHTSGALAALEPGMTARFEAGRVTGFGGCNMFTGPYTLKENRLTVGGLGATMMACPESAMSLERAYHAAMKGTFLVAIVDGRLILTADSGTQLVFEKEAAATLEGGTWSVTGYNNGRQAVISPTVGTPVTVAFENGTVSGDAGCNTFRAPFSIERNRINVGSAATTRKMCDADVMTQEREFLKALESATTWAIDAGLLHLHRADGERVVVAGPRRP
jgi:heat shock protein HslJ